MMIVKAFKAVKAFHIIEKCQRMPILYFYFVTDYGKESFNFNVKNAHSVTFLYDDCQGIQGIQGIQHHRKSANECRYYIFIFYFVTIDGVTFIENKKFDNHLDMTGT
jgi:hypothetical protein